MKLPLRSSFFALSISLLVLNGAHADELSASARIEPAESALSAEDEISGIGAISDLLGGGLLGEGADLEGLLSQIESMRMMALEYYAENIAPQVEEALREVDVERIYRADKRQIQLTLSSDLLGFVLKKSQAFGAEVSPALQDYLQNINSFQITYQHKCETRKADKNLPCARISLDLKREVAIALPSGKRLRDYDVRGILIPRKLSYEIRVAKDKRGQLHACLFADTPRKDSAIRLRTRLTGHVWVNEVRLGLNDWKLRTQVGVLGNSLRVGMPSRDLSGVRDRILGRVSSVGDNLALLLLGPSSIFVDRE